MEKVVLQCRIVGLIHRSRIRTLMGFRNILPRRLELAHRSRIAGLVSSSNNIKFEEREFQL
jgi:hypothetical protein